MSWIRVSLLLVFACSSPPSSQHCLTTANSIPSHLRHHFILAPSWPTSIVVLNSNACSNTWSPLSITFVWRAHCNLPYHMFCLATFVGMSECCNCWLIVFAMETPRFVVQIIILCGVVAFLCILSGGFSSPSHVFVCIQEFATFAFTFS